jgi:uncharacterized protein YhfF
LCIVETTEVTLRMYNEVDAEFAREEGEGDLSLEYWREAHRQLLFPFPVQDRQGVQRGDAARL